MFDVVKIVDEKYENTQDLYNLLNYIFRDKDTGGYCRYFGSANTDPYRPYWWTHAEPEDYAEWFESAAVKELKQFASYIGVSEKDIDLLLEYGYTVDDIEDLLYIPEGVETVVEEILCEYAYCGGEW